MKELFENLKVMLLVPFIILYVFGGLIGAIIEAVDGDLLGVVLSIFIPGYGAVVTIIEIFKPS